MNRLIMTVATMTLLAGCASAPVNNGSLTADSSRDAVPIALAQDQAYLDNLGAIDNFRVLQSRIQQPLSEPAFNPSGTQCLGFAQPLPPGVACP